MAGAGSISSDDFDRANLDTPFLWEFVNPLNDGWVTLVGAGSGDAHLELSVPEGISHDPWLNNHSVRIMQNTIDTDFEVEVKFVSEPTTGYQMQGIIIEQDDNNWLRFDQHHNGTELRLFASTTITGNFLNKLNLVINSGDASFLRVNRTGDIWTFLYSSDGIIWNTAGDFSQALTVSSVGPFVANHIYDATTPAFTAIVDYFFNTASPIDPEDDGPPEDTLAPFIHTIKKLPKDQIRLPSHGIRMNQHSAPLNLVPVHPTVLQPAMAGT